ncbi:MAG: cytochrome c oxidase assembly protein [Actinomycetota bacterium]
MKGIAYHPHPEVWVILGGLLLAYALAARKWGPRYVSPGDPPVTRNQTRLFAAGILAMWVAGEWPLHELSERYLFSAHMLQHMILSLIAPPLVLMGLPGWMTRPLLSPRPVRAVWSFITKPLVAMAAFNGYLVFSHWPGFVDATVRSEPLHFSAHAILFGLSLAMWWPVLSPLPELPRLSPPPRMLYLFGQTIVPTVPASFLTFAEKPLYQWYADAPRIWPFMDVVADQRMAGIIMKIGGGALLWVIIAVLFFRWSSREETGAPDEADWQTLERRLNPGAQQQAKDKVN